MTGGLQTAGQRLTDRPAVAAGAETDTQITYSQQENGMSTFESKASLIKPAWATHSRIADDAPATVYHGNGYEVADRWTDNPNSAATVTVEVFVYDSINLGDSDVAIERAETLVELVGGIVSLPAAAEYADALVTALAQTVAADVTDEDAGRRLDAMLAAADDLRDLVREVAGVDLPDGSAGDAFRALNRCEHGESIHGRCPQCDRARKAVAR